MRDRSDGANPRLMAAVMSAVEAYLEEEAQFATRADSGIRAWRMAARQPDLSMNIRSWKGRD